MAVTTMTLDELVAGLRSAWGDGLRAAVLYGSAASGEHVENRSDRNVLVIVDALGLDRLQAAGEVVGRWAAAGNPAPLTLTSDEWRRSADIFPMEYADVLERHQVLHGALPQGEMHVDPADLRLQLESQAMGKLLQLRSGAVAAGRDATSQGRLLTASLSAFMVLFRALVRLHGERPPAGQEALSRRAASLAGFDAEPYVRVVRHVRGEQALPADQAPATLAQYLAGAERLVAYLDAFDARPAS